MEYRFRFLAPEARIGVYINEYEGDARIFKACISARRVPLTDARLLAVFWLVPLMPLKVMVAIHWQALKLWLRGARFHRMPEQGLYPERVIKQE
jgi:DUF1365 family protein